MWFAYLILIGITAMFPLAAAYDKTRKDLITAVTPEAVKMAKSGYYYYIFFAIWACMMAIPSMIFFSII